MPKIIVSNVPSNFIEEDIRVLFRAFGTIQNITHSANTNSYFITYETKEECSKAIKSMNSRIIQDNPLYVDLAYEREAKCFIFNIPLDSDLTELNAFFSYFGSIASLAFKNNQLEIIFVDKKDCEKLLELNGKIRYKGSLLSIKQTIKKESNTENNTVFVYNLPGTITEQDFYNLFVKYGNILSSGVLDGAKGFVNYSTELGALKAVKYLDNKPFKGKKIKVILKTQKADKRHKT